MQHVLYVCFCLAMFWQHVPCVCFYVLFLFLCFFATHVLCNTCLVFVFMFYVLFLFVCFFATRVAKARAAKEILSKSNGGARGKCVRARMHCRSLPRLTSNGSNYIAL